MCRYPPSTIHRYLDLPSTQRIQTHSSHSHNTTPPLPTLVQAPYPLPTYTTATKTQTHVPHDAIFIMRQVQEKHQAKKKKLYYAFVDLEKEFDRVPREVVRWDLRQLSVDEWLILTAMVLYTEACTVVKTDAGLS